MGSPDEDGRWPVRLGGLIGLETSLDFPGCGLHPHLRETKIAMLSRSPRLLLTACGPSCMTQSWPVALDPAVPRPWRAVFAVDDNHGLAVESLFKSTPSAVALSSVVIHELEFPVHEIRPPRLPRLWKPLLKSPFPT